MREWKIDDLAVRVEPAAPTPRPIVGIDAAQLDACAGEYESLNGILVKVTRAGDHLVVTPLAQAGVEIFPVSATEFVTKDGATQYTFVTAPTDASRATCAARAGEGRCRRGGSTDGCRAAILKAPAEAGAPTNTLSARQSRALVAGRAFVAGRRAVAGRALCRSRLAGPAT